MYSSLQTLEYTDSILFVSAQELALMQIFLVLSRILANYEIVPSNEPLQLSTSSFLTAPKNGVWLKLIKKKQPILSP